MLPKNLSFDHLIGVANRTRKGKVEDGWKLSCARSYMNCNGFNQSMEDAMIEFCALEKDENDGVVNEEVPITCIPSSWKRGVKWWRHIDPPMHLLFLGVCKRVAVEIHKWTVMNRKGTAMLRLSKDVLDDIADLNVSWCKTQPYNGEKFGGWVAESYLGFARVFKWFYSSIMDLEDDVYKAPGKPHNRWTVQENKQWLNARGLPSTGSAGEIRQSVKTLMRQTGAPPLLGPRGGPVKNVYNVVISFHAMISRIMACEMSASTVEDMENHIKLFLSHFHVMTLELHKGDSNRNNPPVWVSAFNFLSLLNIPEISKKFGPIRNLWEGNTFGEGILRSIKPSVHGLRRNWAMNLVSSFVRDKASQCLTHMNRTDETRKCSLVLDVESICRYSSYEAITKSFLARKPMGGFYLKDKKIFAIRVRNGNCHIIGLDRDSALTMHGMVYFKLKLLGQAYEIGMLQEEMISYVLFLPYRSKDVNYDGGYYTIIDKEYHEISEDQSFTLPTVEHMM